MIDGSCAMARLKRLVSRVLMEIVPGGSPQRVNNASGKRFRVFVDCKSVRIGFCPVRIPELIKTACIVARALLDLPEPEVCHPLGADQAVEPLWGACLPQGLSEGRNLMLVGHEPILSQLASMILVGEKDLLPIQVKKGGLVHLRVGVHSGQPKGFLLGLWSAGEIRRLCHA